VTERAPIEAIAGSRLLGMTEAAARALGARLCFGEPVREGQRTIVPVASMATAGGLGFGSRLDESASDGGGWGGIFGTRPVGYIEITSSGTRFRRIVTTADALVALGIVALAAGRFAKARRQSACPDGAHAAVP
jgi:uncharacterized spore protein YtfJ